MKHLTTLIYLLFISLKGTTQIVATVGLDEPVEGMCGETLYSLYSGWEEQQQPVCDLSEQQLIDLMNKKLEYLKTNPKAKGKGVMSIYINCEGTIIQTSSGLKDSDSELSNQIEQFLLDHGKWSPGVYYGKNVDCSELIGFRIKKGVIYLD